MRQLAFCPRCVADNEYRLSSIWWELWFGRGFIRYSDIFLHPFQDKLKISEYHMNPMSGPRSVTIYHDFYLTSFCDPSEPLIAFYE